MTLSRCLTQNWGKMRAMSDAVIGIHQKESDVNNEWLSAASLYTASFLGSLRQLIEQGP